MRRFLASRWREWRWPILALALVMLVRVCLTQGAFLDHLWTKITDPKQDDFWVENVIQTIVFVLGTTWLVNISARHRERRERAPFEGWKWVVLWKDKDGREHRTVDDIYWEDAKRWRFSEFERWRAVKSTLTTFYTIQTPSIEEARQVWMADGMAEGAPPGPVPGEPKTLVIDIRNPGEDHFGPSKNIHVADIAPSDDPAARRNG